MKQTKLFLLCVLLVVSTCLYSGCGLFGDQRYTCEIDDVESIQIISLDEHVEGEYRFEYTVLCEIPDNSAFVEKLVNIEHRTSWGPPQVLDVGYIVIKVNYLNSDYDLIYRNVQWLNRSGVNKNRYFTFNKEQFDKLISDYVT